VHEGGYSNHPSDTAGPTNFGITIADYRAYVKPDATAEDVAKIEATLQQLANVVISTARQDERLIVIERRVDR